MIPFTAIHFGKLTHYVADNPQKETDRELARQSAWHNFHQAVMGQSSDQYFMSLIRKPKGPAKGAVASNAAIFETAQGCLVATDNEYFRLIQCGLAFNRSAVGKFPGNIPQQNVQNLQNLNVYRLIRFFNETFWAAEEAKELPNPFPCQRLLDIVEKGWQALRKNPLDGASNTESILPETVRCRKRNRLFSKIAGDVLTPCRLEGT